MKALIYGAGGDLAQAVGGAFRAKGWTVEELTRGPQLIAYSQHRPDGLHDAYVLPQAVFLKKPLAGSSTSPNSERGTTR